MSRPISESLSLLSETLGNCKTNLKEKSVENVDNIKISDVDEKIAEIKSGGGSNDVIDLNTIDFLNSPYGVSKCLLIITEETDEVLNKIKVNQRELSSTKYLPFYFCEYLAIFIDMSSNEKTFKIDITLEYDGSYSYLTYNDVTIEHKTLKIITGSGH